LYNLYGFAAFDPINGWDPYGTNVRGTGDDGTEDYLGWQRYNPAFRFGVAIYNLAEDDVDKDRRQDLKMKGKYGLGGIRIWNQCTWYRGRWYCGLFGVAALQSGLSFRVARAVKESIKESADAAAKAERKILNGGGGGGKYPVPCKTSFAAGTTVQMCDGSEKAIEEIEVGDYVLGKEESTGEVGCGLVSALHTRIANDIVTLGLRSKGGEVSFEKATTEHPFYVVGRGFVAVGDLKIGDQIETTSGRTEVVSLLSGLWRKSVFNLTVQKYKTYFIGEEKSWVHNCFTKYTSGGNGILAELGSDGILDLAIKTGPETPRGGLMFNEAVKHFGNKVKGIRGTWIGGGDLADNFNAFKTGSSRGASVENPFDTFTGKMAKRNGFDKVEVLKNTESYVEVVFTK